MRVADRVITNNMLTNINRSLNLLNNYGLQGSSGKKIQTPSEDPIIASRALRYRTIVSETEQYLENVSQANAWLQVTESALKNINSITQRMRELCVQGATDTLTTEDRAKVITEFKSLLEQLETELNTTYMGRNIFSGFHTNTNPIIKDENGNNILNPAISTLKAGYTTGQISISKTSNDIITSASANSTVHISYTDKDGTVQNIDITVDLSNITDEVDEEGNNVSNKSDITTALANALNANTTFSNTFTATAEGGKLSFVSNNPEDITGITFKFDDPNGIITITGGTSENGSTANISGQNMNIAVGTSTTIGINSIVTDIYNQDDFKALHALDEIYSIITSEDYKNLSEEEKVEMDKELDIRETLEKMITSIDNYTGRLSIEHTKVGVSINKLELIKSRLTDDNINYKDLRSQNEDVDLAEVSMNYNAANAAYTAALKIGMSINKMTLADYL